LPDYFRAGQVPARPALTDQAEALRITTFPIRSVAAGGFFSLAASR
jgi:hypothetical protein